MKIIIKDGTKYKSIVGGALVDLNLPAPPTESDFTTYGFTDASALTTPLTQKEVTVSGSALGGGSVFEVAVPADLINVVGGE